MPASADTLVNDKPDTSKSETVQAIIGEHGHDSDHDSISESRASRETSRNDHERIVALEEIYLTKPGRSVRKFLAYAAVFAVGLAVGGLTVGFVAATPGHGGLCSNPTSPAPPQTSAMNSGNDVFIVETTPDPTAARK